VSQTSVQSLTIKPIIPKWPSSFFISIFEGFATVVFSKILAVTQLLVTFWEETFLFSGRVTGADDSKAVRDGDGFDWQIRKQKVCDISDYQI